MSRLLTHIHQNPFFFVSKAGTQRLKTLVNMPFSDQVLYLAMQFLMLSGGEVNSIDLLLEPSQFDVYLAMVIIPLTSRLVKHKKTPLTIA